MNCEVRSAECGASPAEASFEPHISKPETARRLNCGLRTLDAWMKRGLIPYYKIGRHVSFVWSEVQEHLRNNCRINRGGSVPDRRNG
jgi:excisionase family DNA binding protein